MKDEHPSEPSVTEDQKNGIVNRRRALMMGAVTASAVVSIKPALAQTVGSVMNCEIPVPGNHAAGGYIDARGSIVPPDTPGAFPASGRNFTGEEVRRAMQGRRLPGTSRRQSRAYVNYIRRLQSGQSGFTCYASLQMPR
ncbi:hypothetical protein [Parasphingorhabdus sp.]|uniref:hypothetical protein n=1 Tax=Parasphingorhabdus sp. TaxID=2709688 RepID=UPI003265FBD3